jgi:hypothetical protein
MLPGVLRSPRAVQVNIEREYPILRQVGPYVEKLMVR